MRFGRQPSPPTGELVRWRKNPVPAGCARTDLHWQMGRSGRAGQCCRRRFERQLGRPTPVLARVAEDRSAASENTARSAGKWNCWKWLLSTLVSPQKSVVLTGSAVQAPLPSKGNIGFAKTNFKSAPCQTDFSELCRAYASQPRAKRLSARREIRWGLLPENTCFTVWAAHFFFISLWAYSTTPHRAGAGSPGEQVPVPFLHLMVFRQI